MKDANRIAYANVFNGCKKIADKTVDYCYYPSCKEKSINSHILQKNGILTILDRNHNGHLIEKKMNHFKENILYFHKCGIKDAFSFNCFCNKHDNDLFKLIEKPNIDFEDYKSRLLFNIRNHFNEVFRKQRMNKLYECLMEHKTQFDTELLGAHHFQGELGLKDLRKTEHLIWNDLNQGTESFEIKLRVMSQIDICLSSVFDYETSEERENYMAEKGKDMECLSAIYINLFPHKSKSILLISYEKGASPNLKGYVDSFIKESEKKLLRMITNLMLFRCETWVCSEPFYHKRVKQYEKDFIDFVHFSTNNFNERRLFDLNIFKDDFGRKLAFWRKEHFSGKTMVPPILQK